MIAACAIVAGADALLVADADYTNILKVLDEEGVIKIRRAEDIVSAQTRFNFRERGSVDVTPLTPDEPIE